jgi:hypothetical protein
LPNPANFLLPNFEGHVVLGIRFIDLPTKNLLVEVFGFLRFWGREFVPAKFTKGQGLLVHGKYSRVTAKYTLCSKKEALRVKWYDRSQPEPY